MPNNSPQFERAYTHPESTNGPAKLVALRGRDFVVDANATTVTLPAADALESLIPPSSRTYLGRLGDMRYFVAAIPADAALPDSFEARELRKLKNVISEEEYGIAGYGSQIAYWLKTSGFCAVCGSVTKSRSNDWGRECVACGHVAYPRIHPAVLILVHDGERILLAHKPDWEARYSIFAGFVEPNESLEDCVRREVKEEANIEVGDLNYGGSQPWPFPNQLMVGFTTRYKSGEVKVDGEELDDALWFTRNTMPELPSSVSLSRKLIDDWVAGKI